MYLDADDGLDEIDPEVRHVPELLAVRIYIYRALKEWDLRQTVAKRMALYDRNWRLSSSREDALQLADCSI